MRQAMTLIGVMALFMVANPYVAILAGLLGFAGDAVDCRVLRQVARRLDNGEPFDAVYRATTFTSAMQALTISACAGLTLLSPIAAMSPIYFMAFLTAAAVDGGIPIVRHFAAGVTRLTIYGATAALGFAYSLLFLDIGGMTSVLNFAGAMILVLIVTTFIRMEITSSRRNRKNLTDLAAKTQSLTLMNVDLSNSEREAKRLSLVAKNANDAVIISDPEGCIHWANDALTGIFGWTLDEVVDRNAADFLNGPNTDPVAIEKLLAARKNGEPFRGEIQNVTKDNRDIWIETNQVPVLDAKGRVEMVVAIERDITQAKIAADELAAAKQKAEVSEQAKATFLAMISHEIRTPINGVVGMADLLCATELTDDQRLYAETIQTSTETLLAILNDVLDMSKLDANKMTIEMADCDVWQLIEETLRLQHSQAEAKGLQLDLEIAPDVPQMVKTDPVRLRQVLLNLISNAVKFTQVGRISVRARAEQTYDGHRLRIVVEDTGIGIPEDKLETIFEEFSQAESSTTRRFGGTGLGLAICRRLLDALGGTITVRSQFGKGTVFAIQVPVLTSVVIANQSGPEPLPDLLPADILVAEDNKVNRLLVKKMLQNTPARLRFANDGQLAVDEVMDHPPDVILMDMSMPRKGGLQAAQEIRAIQDIRQPAIIALTANVGEADRSACAAAGIDAFLSKPIKRKQLISAISTILTDPPPDPPTE